VKAKVRVPSEWFNGASHGRDYKREAVALRLPDRKKA
jgi:hypothetical protein